ncbi:MAG: acyclic terpene utilization AtuA family protein [Pseudomonadales bacterium]
MSNKTVRVGCASAFYGDSQLAARQLVEKGEIDYLVFDYLAEVTMAILSQAKAKNENLGYAVDFVTVAMKDVLADCAKKGIKVVANAGGVNVPACIAALESLCEQQNLNLTVAGVYGDDLTPQKSQLIAQGLPEMQTGAALPEKTASINAYLGARPIVDALVAGADIIVTGRVVDSAVALAPLMYEFGWTASDYDQLAQGSLAGHVIECGAHCTGGNFTDWQLVPDFADMSYPIAEVSEDGSFIVDIPPGTGGMVSIGTVGEQILYEIGDPANYLLPDVACDFTQVHLQEIAKDRVRVSGAKGRSPGPYYKVCATYVDGYRLMSSFFMAGLRSTEKAKASLEAWVRRTQRVFAERGWEDYREVSLDVVGSESIYGPHARELNSREVMGKYGFHHNSREALTFASHEMAYLATSASPGMTGFGAGRVRPQPLIRVHSALLDKSQVAVKVQLGSEIIVDEPYLSDGESEPVKNEHVELESVDLSGETIEVPLEKLAYARSGDKGDNANIGIMARKVEYLPILQDQITAQAVDDYFAHLVKGDVERFDVPGLYAYNFLLTEALGGGGTASLRLDSQAKTYGQMLLSKMVTVPASWFPDGV